MSPAVLLRSAQFRMRRRQAAEPWQGCMKCQNVLGRLELESSGKSGLSNKPPAEFTAQHWDMPLMSGKKRCFKLIWNVSMGLFVVWVSFIPVVIAFTALN